MIFAWKLKSGENYGRQQRHKIHYDTNEYTKISKQTLKEDSNKRNKDLNANAKGRYQLQRKSLNTNSRLNMD